MSDQGGSGAAAREDAASAAGRGTPPRDDGSLAGRHLLLGVTGSIAAYKAVELLRVLVGRGASVQVLMTHSAAAFVGPLTFETLSGHGILSDPLELLPDKRIAHVVAARDADAIVVAPATAHWMAAMAAGLAGDVITATCLASSAPVVVAPAMDAGMYEHPATRGNVERLRSFGYTIVEPAIGPLASGLVGRGRLAEPEAIVSAVTAALSGRRRRDLADRHIVITAGGTAEPIDPVRFIGNRSSGRMGVAVAEEALDRGARVTLIVGQTSVALPPGATVMTAPTTAEMRDAVLAALPGSDALVMAAAVADFRPRHVATTKLTRDQAPAIELEPTEDILAEVAQVARAGRAAPGGSGALGPGAPGGPDAPGGSRRPVLVGFAAETGSLERVAEKVRRKGVDLLVANDVLEPDAGFGVDTNRVTLLAPGAEPEPWPLLSKREVAARLLDRVVGLLGGLSEADATATAPSNARATIPAEPADRGNVAPSVPTITEVRR